MIRELFGPSSKYAMLRSGLDQATAAQRRIANRVANLTNGAANSGFANELARQGGARGNAADLEKSMVELADTQLRFDATAKLLQQAYAGIRTALKNG
jgi:flagellar basal body rod protein FlgB